MKKPTRLSYSSISLYTRCPAAWRYQYIEGVPRTPGKAASRGTDLHSQAERFMKTPEMSPQQLTIEFWRIRETLANIRALRPSSELTMFVDGNWQAVPDESTAVWMAIIDLSYQTSADDIHIIDLKSGRIYDEHVKQLMLYATIVLSLINVKNVHVSGLYLDLGTFGHEATYSREQLPAMQDSWNQARMAVAADNQLAHTPSYLSCRYCDFSAKKGGPCNSYWREETRA